MDIFSNIFSNDMWMVWVATILFAVNVGILANELVNDFILRKGDTENE